MYINIRIYIYTHSHTYYIYTKYIYMCACIYTKGLVNLTEDTESRSRCYPQLYGPQEVRMELNSQSKFLTQKEFEPQTSHLAV